MVAVVTGATGGIGRWIALGLALAGERVVMIGRDQARGDAARAWIAERAGDVPLDLMVADLASLAATRAAGRLIGERFPQISVLVNNAGVFTSRREVTDEGFDRVLATNHLSPFVLTQALLPSLVAQGGARIVNVGSSTADRARLDPDRLQLTRGWGMTRAYAQSKLAMTLTTFALARRLAGSGVVANVVHPGLVATGLVRNGGVIGAAWQLIGRFALTAEQGADTPLFAALAPEMAAVNGGYFSQRRPRRPNRLARDPAFAERVWAATERLAAPP